jgi:hypothetical protein
MTINHRSLAASSARRILLSAVVCLLATLAAGCGDPSRDVTNDFNYYNFATVTGQWKSKKTLTLIQQDNILYLWTSDLPHSTFNQPATQVATLPPGTVISVDHLILHPSFEANTFSLKGSLVAGQYAGTTLELDPELFALNPINTYYIGRQMPATLPTNWQVNPDQLQK